MKVHEPQARGVIDPEFSVTGSFERYMGHVPAAFAVTRGDQHTLVYANAAFCSLVAPDGQPLIGRPLAEAFEKRDSLGLTDLLDRAFRTGVVSRDHRVESSDQDPLFLSCAVWPDVNREGVTENLVVELRVTTQDRKSVV